ncbi:hypothetical protein JTB14_024835 [Gonioctena quinquepunctata]|nr:hypothetical protein JTB14_024835 [Gonioctena quinquepunctata]
MYFHFQLIFTIFLIWTACLRTSHSILSPGVLLALANLQSQRARGLANAMNLRAKTHYNIALARSKANMGILGDPRFIRDSTEYPPDELISLDENSFQNGNDWEDGSGGLIPVNDNGDINQRVGMEEEQGETSYEYPVPKDSSAFEIQSFPSNGLNEPTELRYDGNNLGPAAMSPLSNIEELVPPDNGQKSAAADPHIHSHAHFHQHIISHDHILVPQHPTEQKIVIHKQAPSSPVVPPQEHSIGPSIQQPTLEPILDVHVSHHQHVGEIPINYGDGHSTDQKIVIHKQGPSSPVVPPQEHSIGPSIQQFTLKPILDVHFSQHQQVGEIPFNHGDGHIFRSSTDSQGLPPGENYMDNQQLYSPGDNVIGSSWADENENDQRLGTFFLPLFDTSGPKYPEIRDPQKFDTTQPQNYRGVVKFIEEEKPAIERLIKKVEKNKFHYNGPSYLSETDFNPDYGSDYGREDDESGYYDDQYYDKEKSARMSDVQENVGTRQNTAIDYLNFDPTNPSELNQPNMRSQQDMIADYFATEQKNVQNTLQELQEQHKRNLDNLLHYLKENQSNQNTPHTDNINTKPITNNDYENEYFPESAKNPFNTGDRLEYSPLIGKSAEINAREAEENENNEMLTDFLENIPGIDERIGYSSPENPVLGHIITVPERRYSNEYYQRRKRYLDGGISNDLDRILRRKKKR